MNNLSKKLNELIKIKDEFLSDIIISKSPLSLYEPINYLLKLQGKNTRSILSMLSSTIPKILIIFLAKVSIVELWYR